MRHSLGHLSCFPGSAAERKRQELVRGSNVILCHTSGHSFAAVQRVQYDSIGSGGTNSIRLCLHTLELPVVSCKTRPVFIRSLPLQLRQNREEYYEADAWISACNVQEFGHELHLLDGQLSCAVQALVP